MDRIMAVVTKEGKYAERFCNYVNRSGLIALIAVPFDSTEKCMNYSFTHNIELLITEFDSRKPFSLRDMDKAEAGIKAKRRIYLDASPLENMVFAEGAGAEYIGENIVLKKYQSAEELLSGIVRNAKGSSILKIAASLGHKVDVIGVFDPMTSGTGAVLALSLARECGLKNRTLFMTFSEFSPVLSLLERDAREGVSEAIYQLKQGKLTAEKINSMVIQTEWFDFLCPVSDPDDVRTIHGEDCINLINEILSKANYAYLIVEMDRFSGQADAIMDICDTVYVTQNQGSLSQAKTFKFMDYIEKKRSPDWIKKISLVTVSDVDSERDDMGLFDSQFYGGTGNLARELLEKKENERHEIIY